MILLILWYNLASYIEAAICDTNSCPRSYIGDGICNTDCMNRICNYDSLIENLNDAAVIQDSDCLTTCLEVCSMDLLLNDECDSECSIPECGYDMGKCGDCAHGCFYDMLGNGIRDENCYNQDCMLDQGDFGWCAEGCYEDMIDDRKCDVDCNVKDCMFDLVDCEDISNPELEVMYVTNESKDNKGSGTKDDPYTSLYIALTKVSYRYTIIYLLKGTHYLDIEETDNSVKYPIYNPLARNDVSEHGRVYISTVFCLDDPSLIGCAEDSAVVYVENKIVIESSNKDLIITKVIFSGDHLVCNLNECGDCSIDTCRFCSYVSQLDDGTLKNDKLEYISSEEYQKYGKNCIEIFSEFSFIKAGNNDSLILKDVKFSNFTTWQDSLISFSGLELHLISVDFERIHPGNKQNDAVIQILLPETQVQNRFFRYFRGSVKYINDGYEINSKINLGGFLYIDAYDTKIEILDITFSFNILQNSNLYFYPKALINITGKELDILLEDLTFYNNYSYLGLIDIKLTSNSVATDAYSKVKLFKIIFSKNSSIKGIINFSCNSYLVKFQILSVSFDRCVSTKSSMIKLSNSKFDTLGMKIDEFYRVYINSMLIRIEDLSISTCYSSDNIMYMGDFLHLEVNNFNITTSGDSSKILYDPINEFTLNDFQRHESLSFKNVNPSPYNIISSKLVNFNHIFKIFIQNGFYTSNRWSDFILIYINYSFSVFIDSLTLEDLKSESTISGLIKITSTIEDATIKNCFFSDIQTPSFGSSINIDDISNVTLFNIRMSRYKSIDACISIKFFNQLKMDYCVFDDISSLPIELYSGNTAEVYNSVFSNISSIRQICGFYGYHVEHISFFNTTFRGFKTEYSKALYAYTHHLVIDSCNFDNLISINGAGTGIYVNLYNYNSIDATLVITNSTFTKCISEKSIGCVYIFMAEDAQYLNLSLTSLKFIGCRAKLGSAIFIVHGTKIKRSILQGIHIENNYNKEEGPIYADHSEGILNIMDCKFTGNTGHSASVSVHLSSSNTLLRLQNIEVVGNNCNFSAISLSSSYSLAQVSTYNLQIRNNTCAGIYVNYLYLTDTDSLYDGNVIGVKLENSGIAKMTNATIVNNSNSEKGGGVNIELYSKFECINCKIRGNKSNLGGGLVLNNQSSITLTGTDLSNNNAEKLGSAIYITESDLSISYLIDCDISENISKYEGTIYAMMSTIEIRDSRFKNNISMDSSPGIVMNYSILRLYNTTMQYQNSTVASFLHAQTSSLIDVENSTFEFGMASQNAGAISVTRSEARFLKSVFKDLYSETYAAGFLILGGSLVSIEECSFLNHTSKYPGSVFYAIDSILKISDSVFINNKQVGIYGANLKLLEIYNSNITEGIGAGISCKQCKQINILNSYFADNKSISSGGALDIISDPDSKYNIHLSYFINNHAEYGGAINIDGGSLNILDSHFLDNKAYSQGGAINIDGGSLNISDSYFLNNEAYSQGGAIYMKCTGIEHCTLNIIKSTVQDNTAELAGGGIYCDDITPAVDSYSKSSSSSNSAKYGDWIATNPSKMQFIVEGELIDYSGYIDDTPLAYILHGIAPGQKLEQNLKIALLDNYNQIVTSDNSSFAEIYPYKDKNSLVIGTTKVVANEGLYTFNIQINSEPGISIYLQIATSAIDTTNHDHEGNEEVYYSSILLQVNLRECQIGEDVSYNECKPCEKGSYSLDLEEACRDCPVEAECLGNCTIFPRKHYWRSDMYSDKFYECPNKDACLGSPNYDTYEGECKEGYRGNLCQSCKDGYSRSGENICIECSGELENQITVVMLSLAILTYCVIMVRSTFKVSYAPQSLSSMYIKIFANYLQLVGITVGLDIPWPETLIEFFNIHKNTGDASTQAFFF